MANEFTKAVDSEAPRLDMFLIGAPGAGKTALATAFAEASKDWFESKNMKPLLVLDGLPQALHDDGNVQLGAYGKHFDSAAIYYHGEVRRQRAIQSDRPFLDTQSLIGTLAHINARLNVMQQLIQTPDLQQEMQREFMTGTVLTGYMADRWALNFGWYLPLAEQIIIPGVQKETFPVAVDAVLRDMNVKLGLGIPLLDGTVDERVKGMLSDLDQFYNFDNSAEDTEAV